MFRMLLLGFLLFCLVNLCAQPKRVLFLGNSYTDYNQLPQQVRQLALAAGDTLVVDSRTPGGYTFQNHAADAQTLQKIRQGPWDWVVLQEQSQLPAFPDNQVNVQVFPHAASLRDSILAHSPCAEIVFYMTWGRQNGDAQNCAVLPAVCTYEGMQERLYQTYLRLADSNEAICAPVGAAWRLVRQQYPWLNLYTQDASHPSPAGSYLAATTIYATLYRRSPVNLAYYASLSDTLAQRIQGAVGPLVLDSLEQWRVGRWLPQAQANWQSNGLQVQFQNLSSRASQYRWIFGDGQESFDFQPQHNYSNPGNYALQLIASDDCNRSDTLNFNLQVDFALNHTALAWEETAPLVQAQAGQWLLYNPQEQSLSLRLYDALGRSLPLPQTKFHQQGWHSLSPPQQAGIYYLEILNAENQRFIFKLPRPY